MSLDRRLLSLIVCPLCKGPLVLTHDPDARPKELVCPADRLGFPIRDGMPVMLEDQARALPDTEDAPRATT